MGERLHYKRLFANKRPSRVSLRGFTIVEVLIVLSVFGMLVSAVFLVFDMGLKAWQKSSTKNELLQQAQITNLKLGADVERSSLASLSIDDTPATPIAALLSPLNDDQQFESDNRGRPVWQKYLCYYLDKSEGVIYRREVDLTPTAPQRTTPTPIEFYNDGTGPKTLLSYRTGGQPVSRFVEEFELEVLPEPVSQLSWRLTMSRTLGSDRRETLNTYVSIHLRN